MTRTVPLRDKQEEHKQKYDRQRCDKQTAMIFVMPNLAHNPVLIQWFIEEWMTVGKPFSIDIVATEHFMKKMEARFFQIAEDWTEQSQENRLRFIPFPPEEEQPATSSSSLIDRVYQHTANFNSSLSKRISRYQEWQQFQHYVKRYRPDTCLFLNFDIYQYPPAIGMKLHCPFSVVFHGLMLHYEDLWAFHFDRRDRMKARLQRWLLRRLSHHNELEKVLCLDPFVAEYINEEIEGIEATALPTSAKVYDDNQAEMDTIRQRIGVENGRTIFLLLGNVRPRRGALHVLEALHLLPEEIAMQCCILFVGGHNRYTPLYEAIQQAQGETTAQVISVDTYIPEREIMPYYNLSDVVLLLHQQHIGTSNSIVYAAAAKKPVLGTDYGLLGEWTRQYKLGLAIDSMSIQAIADGITLFIENPRDEFLDIDSACRFAEINTASKAARTLIDHLGQTLEQGPLASNANEIRISQS